MSKANLKNLNTCSVSKYPINVYFFKNTKYSLFFKLKKSALFFKKKTDWFFFGKNTALLFYLKKKTNLAGFLSFPFYPIFAFKNNQTELFLKKKIKF